jgi:hypothetical protein
LITRQTTESFLGGFCTPERGKGRQKSTKKKNRRKRSKMNIAKKPNGENKFEPLLAKKLKG